jgi:hypothetical protein
MDLRFEFDVSNHVLLFILFFPFLLWPVPSSALPLPPARLKVALRLQLLARADSLWATSPGEREGLSSGGLGVSVYLVPLLYASAGFVHGALSAKDLDGELDVTHMRDCIACCSRRWCWNGR